jgi:hypothetical protein
MKANTGGRGTAPLIRNNDSRWRYVVNFTPRRLYPRKEGQYPLHRRLIGPPATLEILEKKKSLDHNRIRTPASLRLPFHNLQYLLPRFREYFLNFLVWKKFKCVEIIFDHPFVKIIKIISMISCCIRRVRKILSELENGGTKDCGYSLIKSFSPNRRQ